MLYKDSCQIMKQLWIESGFFKWMKHIMYK